MGLAAYKKKRNFRRTPEPKGNGAVTPGQHFVIQKHAASRLHYDLRLELDKTLKSWAVPKGPSLDPAVKSLAVHVEDHPLEYASFEGVIPQGEYGGGTVMVWDHGTWEPEGEGNAARDYKHGKLKFTLHGEKLHGSWALVRMGGKASDGGKNWLLIKHDDKAARPGDDHQFVEKKRRSVLTNRDMDEIANDADRVWSSNKNGKANGKPAATKQTAKSRKTSAKKATPASSREIAKLTGARKSPQRADFKPQLATLVSAVPAGENWLHELKFDGYRMLAFVEKGKVRLVTRNGNDWSKKFPSLIAAIEASPIKDGILDGEVVSLDKQGLSNFQQLQNLLKRGDDDAIVYYVFDLPHCHGYDLTKTPLIERKELLVRLLRSAFPKADGQIRYSDHIRGQGESVLAHACRYAMEGVVCKREDSNYQSARSPSWVKVKCLKRQEFVIGGYTKPTGTRVGFGALLLGYYEGSKLTFCGKVGTGFTIASLKQLKTELTKRKTDTTPFDNPPRGAEARGVTWVKPELVGEVEFTEWTSDGSLRHPSFQGLREDKPAKQIVREKARPVKAVEHAVSNGKMNGKLTKARTTKSTKSTKRSKTAASENGDSTVAGVSISHPDRVLYPEQGVTKLDLAEYFAEVADFVLPHIVGRPLTLVRCPQGSKGQCFYQKHVTDTMPDSVHGVVVDEKDKSSKYVVVDDLTGLISLVQMGVLEFHPWGALSRDLEHPDRIVIDLDPGPGVPWKRVINGAREVRDALSERGLKSFVRTSGGKGLHVVVPIQPKSSWDEMKSFAKDLADSFAAGSPTEYIAKATKAKRHGKIFIDYLRNGRGATAVASYSSRARAGAPVAMPLSWEELGRTKAPDQFNVVNAPRRIRSRKGDPWQDFFKIRQSL